MVDIDAVIELFREEDMDLDFKLGGERVFTVKAKDANIDVTIFDAKAFKGLLRRARRCRS